MVQIVSREQIKEFVGVDTGHSPWHKISQDDVNKFADSTYDHQFIHVDEEKAKLTPFGGTIVHGFMSLSLLSYLIPENAVVPENVVMAINYGVNKVRFLTPIRVGSEVRSRGSIVDIVEKAPGQFLITNKVTLEIKGEAKPALIAETLGMYFTEV